MLKEYKMTEIGILPVDWKIRKIRDLFKVTAGGDIDQAKFKKQVDRNHIYPVYSNALSNRGIYGYYSTYEYDGEHITITARGDVGHAQNRSGRFVAVGRVLVLKANEIIDYKYFADFINYSVKFQVEITGVPQLTAPQAASHFVAVPPLPEQQKIADILTTVDDHISETEALIEKTKVLKQGLMQQLLTKGIGHTEFKDTEIGRIPVKWKVFKLENVAKINKKSLPNSTLDSLLIDYIDIESVSPGKINKYSTVKFGSAPSRARRVLSIGDTIVSTVRPYLRAIAYISQLKENTLICSTGFASVSPFGINPQFAYQFILSDVFLDQLKVKMVGSNYPAVNSSDVCESLVPLPPLSEQRQIAAILTSVDDQIDTYQAKLASLTKLKSGLMQQLLTGKIRVKV